MSEGERQCFEQLSCRVVAHELKWTLIAKEVLLNLFNKSVMLQDDEVLNFVIVLHSHLSFFQYYAFDNSIIRIIISIQIITSLNSGKRAQ